MTKTPPTLVDRSALARNRVRTPAPEPFLHNEAICDIQDRLSLVNKSFSRTAIVTGHPSLWANAVSGAGIFQDDDMLKLDSGTYDLIIHAMALHWAKDPVGQLIQCRRALKPDGLLLAILPGGSTLNELRTSLSEAEISIRGGLSPRVLPMGDIRDLGSLLQRAGFALPVADSFNVKTEYDTLRSLMLDLRVMGETNALMARPRSFARRDVFEKAEHVYKTHFPGTKKTLTASFELVTLTGWAPSARQQQPLRPGSATTRLADALGTTEEPLQD